MSGESQFPKNSKLGKLKGWAQLLGTLIAVGGGVYTAATGLWGNVTTDSELIAHDQNPVAHSSLRDRLDECKERGNILSKRVEEEHLATVELGARLVRIDAADREPKHILKAAAASYYEGEYRRLVSRGVPVFEAVLDSMRGPWYNRPH